MIEVLTSAKNNFRIVFLNIKIVETLNITPNTVHTIVKEL